MYIQGRGRTTTTSNWLAAYALGAGFARPESPEAVETIAGVAGHDPRLLRAARRAVMSQGSVDGETRAEALRLLELADRQLGLAVPAEAVAL